MKFIRICRQFKKKLQSVHMLINGQPKNEHSIPTYIFTEITKVLFDFIITNVLKGHFNLILNTIRTTCLFGEEISDQLFVFDLLRRQDYPLGTQFKHYKFNDILLIRFKQ